MVDDPLMVGLLERCEANPDDNDSDHWASSVTILKFLGYDQLRKADTMSLAAAAKKLGLKKQDKNKIRGYLGVVIPQPSKFAPKNP